MSSPLREEEREALTSLMSKAELDFRVLVSRLYWGTPEPCDWGNCKEHPQVKPRPIFIVPIYADYSHLSGVVIQINGSPPKGTIAALINPDLFGVHVFQVTFLASGRSRTLSPHSKPFDIVERFIDELIEREVIAKREASSK